MGQKKKRIIRAGYLAFLTFVCMLNAASLFARSGNEMRWEQVEPGVWKGTFGTPEDYSLLEASGAEPLEEGFLSLPDVEIPALHADITATVQDGKTYLSIPLEKKEQIYGLGLNFQSVFQRGKVLNLHVDHYGGRDDGRTHAPVPFYVSSRGYGILVNSARYLTVYAGSGIRKDSPHAEKAKDRNTDKSWTAQPYSDAVSILIPAEGVEVYLFAGPAPLDVVRRYNLLCGGGVLPPRWGLGFTQRTPTLYTSAQVEKEVDDFERYGYPLDFIGLEPGWQSRAYPCSLEWDDSRYPDPAGFVRRLMDKGVRINLWTNPYISPESELYDKMYPLSGSHTVWNGIVPDFADEKAQCLWKEKLLQEHVGIGVSGYKIDEVDGYDRWLWPDVAVFPSGISAEQMRQTYGLLVQRTTTEIFRERNQRTYGLVRSSNAGASGLPYVLYNDYYNHRDFITALVNSGFCGLLWTPEVRGTKSAEEWVRRFQSVVFSPMAMIDSWASAVKPWTFPEVAGTIKEYALLRMRLMPYFYTEFAKYHFEGTPPFRAMYLEPGFGPEGIAASRGKEQNLEENPYLETVAKEIRDQYMAGEYLLVAPMFVGETSRKVVLPEGNWYDFYTGDYVGNGETITVSPGLERIPVFVKDGGIIPMMEAVLHAPRSGQKVNLEIRHYGKSDGACRLYDDDGETYDYEKGVCSWRNIKVKRQKNGKLKGSISKSESGKPDSVNKVTWVFMTEGNEPSEL